MINSNKYTNTSNQIKTAGVSGGSVASLGAWLGWLLLGKGREGRLQGAEEQLGGGGVERVQVGNSSKNLHPEEVRQGADPQRLGFPESGFGFSGFGQTRGCYRNGPSLYLADASYPSEGDLPQSILSQIPPLCQLNKDDMNTIRDDIVSLFSSKIQGPRRQASFLSVPFCFPFTKSCQALCWH